MWFINTQSATEIYNASNDKMLFKYYLVVQPRRLDQEKFVEVIISFNKKIFKQ